MKKWICFILLGIMSLPGGSSAQQGRESSLDELLESVEEFVVVTASKKAQKISEAPAVIGVITKGDIERMGAVTLIDVLKYVPTIETSLGPDGNYRVSIRGIRKDGNVLMLVDGHHLNDFYDGRAIYDLSVDFIEQIEIIRGPGSALFGTNAVAGVINIITQKENNWVKGRRASGNAGGGSFSQFIVRDSLKIYLQAGAFKSDGINESIEQDGGRGETTAPTWDLPLVKADAQTNRYLTDDFLRLKVNRGDLNFSLFAFYRARGSWVGPLFILAPQSKYKEGLVVWDVDYHWQVNNKLSIRPRLYNDITRHNYLIEEAPDLYRLTFRNGRQTEEKYTGVNIGGEVQINYTLGEHVELITGPVFEHLFMADYSVRRNYRVAGLEYKGDFGDYDDIDFQQKDKTRDVFAYYLQGTYQRDKWGLTAGFRYDNYSDFGQSFNPRLGLILKPFEFMNLKALYGEAFRAPTFKELYDRTNLGSDGVRGNENLSSESVRSLEFAGELKYKNRYAMRGSFFYNWIDDVISVYDLNGSGGVGDYENLGNEKNYGFDVEVSLKPVNQARIFANFSNFLTEFDWNTNSAIITTGDKKELSRVDKYLRNIPIYRLNAGVDLTAGRWIGFVGVNYASKAENNRRTTLERLRNVTIASYWQANASLSYQVRPRLTLQVTGQNLGDDKYVDPDESTNINALGGKGLIQPGQMYIITVRYAF